MKQYYKQHKLEAFEQQRMNELIKEQVCEVADQLVRKDCENLHIQCYKGKRHTNYTEQAQDMFNSYYDDLMEDMYKFVNEVIETHLK
jgi:hypothetical protein